MVMHRPTRCTSNVMRHPLSWTIYFDPDALSIVQCLRCTIHRAVRRNDLRVSRNSLESGIPESDGVRWVGEAVRHWFFMVGGGRSMCAASNNEDQTITM